MIERTVLVVNSYGRHHLADIAYLTASTDDDCSRRDNLLAVGILLTQRQGVLTSRHIHMQGTAEIAQCLHGSIQSGIFAFLRTTGPHPVSTQ